MRLLRTVGVWVLSLGLCLLLAWATMVIVHASPQEEGSGVERFPTPAGAPPAPSAGDPLHPPHEPAAAPAPEMPEAELREFSEEYEGGNYGPGNDPFIGPGGHVMGPHKDPLQGVSDLSKGTLDQLQQSDRYLHQDTLNKANSYRALETAEAKAKLKADMAKTIQRHFDVRHEIRKREIDELEARVRRLREHLQKREAARQTICEMRLNQFISAADGLGWDTDFGRGRSSEYGSSRYGYDGPGAMMDMPGQ